MGMIFPFKAEEISYRKVPSSPMDEGKMNTGTFMGWGWVAGGCIPRNLGSPKDPNLYDLSVSYILLYHGILPCTQPHHICPTYTTTTQVVYKLQF